MRCCARGLIACTPRPIPAKAKPMMVPRRLINHTDSRAAWVTCPARPTPRPTRTPNSTVKCHSSCTILHAASPTAMLSKPLTTTRRGPQRSMSMPHTGDRRAWTILPTEKAAAGIEPDDAGFQVRRKPLGCGGSFGKAWTDAIDMDVIASHLFGHGLGERHHCRLRPRIDGLPHFPNPTSIRGDVDNLTAPL